VSKLKAEISVVSAQLKDNRTAQLETRLATLADSVVEKQGTIDQLISEKVPQWFCSLTFNPSLVLPVGMFRVPCLSDWNWSGSGGELPRKP
jgi:hypothetical protein